jgi:CBS domain-containing protein
MTNADTMTIGMLIGSEVQCIAPDATLLDAAVAMDEAGIGSLVVGTQADVKGIVSERDVVRAVAQGQDLATLAVGEVASTKLVWADEGSPMTDVALEMTEKWVRHVLVENDGVLAGIVSARDLLGAYAMDATD